jgi:hypothetical protein
VREHHGESNEVPTYETPNSVDPQSYPLPMIQGYTIKVTDRTVSGLFGLMTTIGFPDSPSPDPSE